MLDAANNEVDVEDALQEGQSFYKGFAGPQPRHPLKIGIIGRFMWY